MKVFTPKINKVLGTLERTLKQLDEVVVEETRKISRLDRDMYRKDCQEAAKEKARKAKAKKKKDKVVKKVQEASDAADRARVVRDNMSTLLGKS